MFEDAEGLEVPIVPTMIVARNPYNARSPQRRKGVTTAGIVLNVLEEEIPEERESGFAASARGAALYAAALVVALQGGVDKRRSSSWQRHRPLPTRYRGVKSEKMATTGERLSWSPWVASRFLRRPRSERGGKVSRWGG